MNFGIELQPIAGISVDELSEIAIRAAGVPMTRLIRPPDTESSVFLRVPGATLAFWLVDHWWRLRWESIPPHSEHLSWDIHGDWRLSHDFATIGAGYAWPNLMVWGEDSRIGLLARSDPQGVVGPVRYLTDAIAFVKASEYEHEIDRFLDQCALYSSSDCATSLRAEIDWLRNERNDERISHWRRLEARLGYDPDEAPENLVEELLKLSAAFGADGVEEAIAAAPGEGSAETLESEIQAADRSPLECNFSSAIASCDETSAAAKDPGCSPWQRAERVASGLRKNLGLGSGPFRNRALSDYLSVPQSGLEKRAHRENSMLPYGLRYRSGRNQGRDSILLKSYWSHDRRFEIMRALGDAIWSNEDRLGPLARSKTARQKFQRAFAQSMLCPFDGLMSYLGRGEGLNDGDITAAARHFHVSETVVRTVLVNKRQVERERLLNLGTEAIGFEPEALEVA